MSNPKDTVQHLKRWETEALSDDLLATLREARECIEGLCEDFEALEKYYEQQQQDDDERRHG